MFRNIGETTYYITYEYKQPGVIVYDYEIVNLKDVYFQVVNGVIAAAFFVGGIYAIVQSGGAAAPVVVPVLKELLT